MKEQDETENLFRSTFDDFTVAPPTAVKESIDLAIAGSGRKRRFWFFAICCIGIVALAVSTIFQTNNAHKTSLPSTHSPTSGIISTDAKQKPGIKNSGAEDPSRTAGPGATNQNQQTTVRGKSFNDKNAPSAFDSGEIDGGNSKVVLNSKKSQMARYGNRSSLISKSKKPRTGKARKNKNIFPVAAVDPAGERPDPATAAQKTGEKDPGKQNEADSLQNDMAEPEKTVQEADSAQAAASDSSIAIEAPDVESQPGKARKPMLLSLRTGTTFGFNRLKSNENYQFSEKKAFFIQGEAAYFFKPNMALASGLNYEQRTENISLPKLVLDSVIAGYNLVPVVDSGLVVDTIYVPVYSISGSTVSQQNMHKAYAFSVPLLFTYAYQLTPKWHLDLSAGAILGFQGIKRSLFDSIVHTTHNFGLKACVRTQLRYQFSEWGVSLNTNFGYDLIPVQSWSGVKRRRTYLDLGIGVHYIIGK